jgi:serine O-acetyltransferase
VVVAAGAKVLGNIELGEYAKVGANAVVVTDVPPHSTVVGVPGRVVTLAGSKVKGTRTGSHQFTRPFCAVWNIWKEI